MAKALSPGATARRQRDNGRPSHTLAAETVSAIGGQPRAVASALSPPGRCSRRTERDFDRHQPFDALAKNERHIRFLLRNQSWCTKLKCNRQKMKLRRTLSARL